ncbi:hypothetical protein Golax_024379, partial [Gossypium laxum]|nr:hypothetical protein [Gossypium laxum]
MVAIRKSQAMRRVMKRKTVRMMAKWRIAMKMMKQITRKIWKKRHMTWMVRWNRKEFPPAHPMRRYSISRSA